LDVEAGLGVGLKDETAVVVVDVAVVVWAEEEHEPVWDDVGDKKGAGISDECKANVEGRRMSRAAEISLMTEPQQMRKTERRQSG